MKILIIYDTKFGNNNTVANKVQDLLKDQHEIYVYSVKGISPKNAVKLSPDAFIFGGPRRMGKIKKSIRKWVDKFQKTLEKENYTLQKVAAWETRMKEQKEMETDFEKKIFEKNEKIWTDLVNGFHASELSLQRLGVGIVLEEEGSLKSGKLEEEALEKVTEYIEKFIS